jgi:mitogen-activated protein kinase kinase kinase 2
MQDLAVLHKASRPALSLQETRKAKPSSPKKQVFISVMLK